MSQDNSQFNQEGGNQQQQQPAMSNQAPAPSMLQANGQMFGNINPAALATMLQQQQQQQQLQGDKDNLSIANEIKRLQQIHQMNVGGAPNALLMSGAGGTTGGQQQASNNAAFFQSMLDQQKQGGAPGNIPNPRFDNPLAQSMGGTGVNPMLQPAFFQDPTRLFMNPGLNANPPAAGFLPNDIPLPSPHSLFHRDGSRRMRGGVIEPFPEKLHRLLSEVEAAGRSDVISFVASGRAFAIHKPEKFFKEIVPLYFRQSRLSSFKRQLNLYGFELINTGPARGGYYHELFVKDRPELCRRMRRVAVKVSSKQDKDGEGKGGPPPELLGEEFGDKVHEEEDKLKTEEEEKGNDGAESPSQEV
jgi:hypothetical protein